MKILLALMLTLSSLAYGRDDNLSRGHTPKKYAKRTEAILNVGLVYYGNYYTEDDLSRVQVMFEERFAEATNQMIKLNVVVKAVLPFKHQISSYPDFTHPEITDMDRLQRIWYYKNVGAKVLPEIYDQVKADEKIKPYLKQIDVLIAITGAQFDAIGYANGRIAVTENPTEIAWDLKGGGSVEFQSDAKVVDELIHETGHTLFLDHASSHCFAQGMEYPDLLKCCAQSPGKDDVMSACRARTKVDEKVFYKFGECNLRNLKDRVVPAMLSGGRWNVENREKCI